MTRPSVGGWCANHQHAMTYATDHGGYWYCDISGKPNWPVATAHSDTECARCATREPCPHLDRLLAIPLPAAPEMHPTNRDLNQMEGP